MAISAFGLANILRSGQRIGLGDRSCPERVRERQNEKNIAAEKPEGIPEENWLPINRKDENLDIVLRIYVPDLERMKTWTAPKPGMEPLAGNSLRIPLISSQAP